MQFLKNYLNKKNLKQYAKITSEINKISEKLLKEKFSNGVTKEQVQQELLAIRENKSLTPMNKTKQAIAIAKLASQEVLGMSYYNVQIQGALALTDGNIAEMKTGEGKTLTCTAAVASNFVLGFKTHVVTSNEYLAVRDLELLKPLYEFMGISCQYNISKSTKEEKREAYNSDVLYSVASELGFDYLRDNLVLKKEDKVQNFDFKKTKALIDEADSILIDECRTPLIISSQLPDATGGRHNIIIDIINQLEKMAKEPHPSPLVEEYIPGDFWLDEKSKKSHISDEGYVKIEKLAVEHQLITSPEELYYSKNSWILREINNAISAKYLYLKDREYIIKNGEIVIIDANTGRLAEGRSWGEGLHQAIEAKEGLEIKPENASSGSISIQNYFLMYAQISGMSGTIMTSSEEFEFIYNSTTISIPKNKPEKRIDLPDRLYGLAEDKYLDIIEEIKMRRSKNQPILLGTVSVQESEIVSNLLTKNNIPHSVLNAKNHHYEAQIIAQAGKPGNVTVSTSMAGRGTDIILGGNKEAFIEILDKQLSIIQDRRLFLNNFYHAAYNFTVEQLLAQYDQQNSLIEQIKEEEGKETPHRFAQEVSNEELLKGITEQNNQLKAYLESNLKELLELREKNQLKEHQDTKELDNSDLLNHLEKRKNDQQSELDEYDILSQISSKNKESLNDAKSIAQEEVQAIESKKRVEAFKDEVQKEAVEQGISEENNSTPQESTLNENSVLNENILPQSFIDKIQSNKKPEIKMGPIMASFKFTDEMLHQGSEFQKEILENRNFSQQMQINPLEFNLSDRNEDFTTTEIVDYHIVTPFMLAMYHPVFCKYLTHNGYAFFNRILNVLENTVRHERNLVETEYSKWKEQVIASGGLCVIGCSRNESRRIDNQLIGRAGRQGDKGTSIFFLSLEDAWFEVFVKDNPKIYNNLKLQLNKVKKDYDNDIKNNKANSEPVKYLSNSFLSYSLANIQQKREAAQYSGRKHTFQFDSAANDARQGFLSIRNSILNDHNILKDKLKSALKEALKPISHEGFFDHLESKLKIENSSIEAIMQGVYNMPFDGMIEYAQLYLKDPENTYLIPILEQNREIDFNVQEKLNSIIDTRLEDLTEQEYQELALMSLQSLDQQWIAALNVMEEMNQSVGLRQIAQKNPIYEFKNLCFEVFQGILKEFNENLIEHYNHIIDIRKHAEILEQSMNEEDDIVDAEISNEISFSAINNELSNAISIDEYKSEYLEPSSQETEKTH